ncbi:hypothetical protein BIFGAL_04435 [Bifidobacterium gallicum DSM 20093 = LMG 11596]|uniref:Uncharacterized protein n=1 Tax=Bifidobacterium gallicum DSM 20093 = LMG 11596 TaxID=561180 RepID=D1NX26_9BIFI|nr:hypothetical protein BIFGAL_04435 [Bifidobacterium gallicum DSM 20093 = LMG 11596]
MSCIAKAIGVIGPYIKKFVKESIGHVGPDVVGGENGNQKE